MLNPRGQPCGLRRLALRYRISRRPAFGGGAAAGIAVTGRAGERPASRGAHHGPEPAGPGSLTVDRLERSVVVVGVEHQQSLRASGRAAVRMSHA